MSENDGKTIIDYPCVWQYKIIGTDQDGMHGAIKELVHGEHLLSYANSSSKGKYTSLSLEITVANEKERDALFISLKQHPAIKMVL